MPRRSSFSSQLYRAARSARTLEAIAPGNPRRVARRAKNIAVGRALGKAGVWRILWGGRGADGWATRFRTATRSAGASTSGVRRSGPTPISRASGERLPGPGSRVKAAGNPYGERPFGDSSAGSCQAPGSKPRPVVTSNYPGAPKAATLAKAPATKSGARK
jgi:hypothetical protein